MLMAYSQIPNYVKDKIELFFGNKILAKFPNFCGSSNLGKFLLAKIFEV